MFPDHGPDMVSESPARTEPVSGWPWPSVTVSLNMLGKINMAGHSRKQCILSRVESEARVHWHARKPQVAKWHTTTFKLKLRDAGLPVPARERERRRGARI